MTIAQADITQRTAGLYANGRTAGHVQNAVPTAKSPGVLQSDSEHFDRILQNAQRGNAARTAGSAAEAQRAAASGDGDGDEAGGGFIGFIKAVIDVINPLQHLPVISTIYRHMTGDELSPVARIAGDALYGGPVGLAMGVVNAAVESSTGKDVGETVLAMAFGSDNKQKLPGMPPTDTTAPIMIAASDIIWNEPDSAAETQQNTPTENSTAHGTMIAMADGQEILSAVTPTHLRTRPERMDEPVKSLPYAPPVHTTKKGMLAPTESMQMVSGAGLTAAPDAVGERTPAPHPAEAVVATTTVPGSLKPGASPILQLQDAPVDDARRASSPEQIAHTKGNDVQMSKDGSLGIVAPVADRSLIPQQMADALEKYAAMKRGENAAATRGLVSVHY